MKDKDRTIESLKTRLADQSSHSEKKTNKTSSHGYVPGRSNKNKAELAPSCKITMAAKASHT